MTNTVANISDMSLTGEDKSLLSKGVSFFPRPSHINRFQMGHDLKQFERRLRLKEFFYNLDETISDIQWNPFTRRSKWTPRGGSRIFKWEGLRPKS